MRPDEKYQPNLPWRQDRYDDQIYHAYVDGKQAGSILKTTLAGNEPTWSWFGADAGKFKRCYPKSLRDRGYEKTARLAVQRAEEYFEVVMSMPVYVSPALR